ncbi:GlsB/YeaQ/YmgE family stress response membrane protein [Microcoleus sp. FACHB-1515]|uniref:GlsB/YeaQ/YmgE family stress response membrane protein n=1 Tax=Cyanophyceae TaxID=3028117 RepID=UPI0016843EA1|nr:GlsB/YeaQ/YmgE family stress response membrane protein [Microcoleus sp. FACHB-1515]MBD2089914.1 GlsB/YeaQ/YmgE family stress response membrane protein [Microcoleus sp. FACHB-1515]
MGILAWIVLGLIAGAIAKAIYPGRQGGGILGTMLLGVIGAFVGGLIYSLLVYNSLQIAATSFSIPGIAIAVLGAVIALFIWGALNRRSAA